MQDELETLSIDIDDTPTEPVKRRRGRPRKTDGSPTRTRKTVSREQSTEQFCAVIAGATLLLASLMVKQESFYLLPSDDELTAILVPLERLRHRHFGDLTDKLRDDGADIYTFIMAFIAYTVRVRDERRKTIERNYSQRQTPHADVARHFSEQDENQHVFTTTAPNDKDGTHTHSSGATENTGTADDKLNALLAKDYEYRLANGNL